MIRVIVTCDVCGQTRMGPVGWDCSDTRADARENGWDTARGSRGDRCPECKTRSAT